MPDRLLPNHPRPWRYQPDHDGADFGDVLNARTDGTIDDRTVARLMDEADALELIDFANRED